MGIALDLRQPGKSGQPTPTPAMMARLVETLWTIEDLCDAAMKQQADKKHAAGVAKLIDRLQRHGVYLSVHGRGPVAAEATQQR